MRDRIVLNRTEQRRVSVLNHLDSGALVNSEAAQLLGISVRQVQRLHRAYREQGVAGLAHGNRGRPARNVVDSATAERIVELARTRYQGFNHQHLTEMLAENHDIALSRPTVRRILLAAGMGSPRADAPNSGRLLKEWGVQLTLPRPRQPKGRTEPPWGPFRARRAGERRRGGPANCDKPNRAPPPFFPRHNRRFVVSPQQP